MRHLIRIVAVVVVLALIGLAALALVRADIDVDTDVTIDAPPERVWAVLRDVERYAEWNPYIESIAGDWEKGAELRIAVRLPGDRRLSFPAVVKGAEENYELRWQAELPVPRTLVAKHKLIMTPNEQGGTRLRNEEEFRGLLVGAFTAAMLHRLGERFEAMNQALKARVEAPQ